MVKNLNSVTVKLFKFDHSVDYLPYYRTYTILYDENDCVYDVLNKINQIEPFSYDEKNNCNVCINNYFLEATELVSELVAKIGDDFKIEPISLYRVTNDLQINTQDYEDKLSLFDDFITQEEKKQYKEKYILEYYSSLSMIINKAYIGDHCLLIADEILKKDASKEKEIFKILTDKDKGMLYHTSLKARLLKNRYGVDEVFLKLLAKIPQYKNIQLRENEKSIVNEDIEVSQFFKGFNIALYNQEGCLFRKIIEKSRATYIKLSSRRYDLARHSFFVNQTFSLKIAGEILLEAKDANADFLIVKDKKDLEIFDIKQKEIVNEVNREINLPVVTQMQFEQLLQGEKDIKVLGFNTHKVKVEFL